MEGRWNFGAIGCTQCYIFYLPHGPHNVFALFRSSPWTFIPTLAFWSTKLAINKTSRNEWVMNDFGERGTSFPRNFCFPRVVPYGKYCIRGKNTADCFRQRLVQFTAKTKPSDCPKTHLCATAHADVFAPSSTSHMALGAPPRGGRSGYIEIGILNSNTPLTGAEFPAEYKSS